MKNDRNMNVRAISVQKSAVAPEKKIRAGPISATIWKNDVLRGTELGAFYSITIERVYKDKDNKWQNTHSMRINDLPKAALVLQKAFEYLVLKDKSNAAKQAASSYEEAAEPEQVSVEDVY